MSPRGDRVSGRGSGFRVGLPVGVRFRLGLGLGWFGAIWGFAPESKPSCQASSRTAVASTDSPRCRIYHMFPKDFVMIMNTIMFV